MTKIPLCKTLILLVTNFLVLCITCPSLSCALPVSEVPSPSVVSSSSSSATTATSHSGSNAGSVASAGSATGECIIQYCPTLGNSYYKPCQPCPVPRSLSSAATFDAAIVPEKGRWFKPEAPPCLRVSAVSCNIARKPLALATLSPPPSHRIKKLRKRTLVGRNGKQSGGNSAGNEDGNEDGNENENRDGNRNGQGHATLPVEPVGKD